MAVLCTVFEIPSRPIDQQPERYAGQDGSLGYRSADIDGSSLGFKESRGDYQSRVEVAGLLKRGMQKLREKLRNKKDL